MFIGVVGNGVVGGAVVNGFTEFKDCQVQAYDIDPAKSTHSLKDVVNCDFVFVCLPTPPYDDGHTNLEIIEDFFDEAVGLIDSGKYEDTDGPIFILKSTVPVGTTLRLKNNTDLPIVHSPEFLTARTARADFLTPTRNIVGHTCGQWCTQQVKLLYWNRWPNVPVHVMTSDESEFVKYVCNCFYATKISFFNEMRLFADNKGLDWEAIMSGVLSSGWINPMHTQVPGPDGKRGFGGNCFNKDVASLTNQFEDQKIDPYILKAAVDRNTTVRNLCEILKD